MQFGLISCFHRDVIVLYFLLDIYDSVARALPF